MTEPLMVAEVGVPLTGAEVARAAAAIGLDLPPECLPGVAANLAALAEHAARVAEE